MRQINSIYAHNSLIKHMDTMAPYSGEDINPSLFVMTLIYWNLSGTFTGQHGDVVDILGVDKGRSLIY